MSKLPENALPPEHVLWEIWHGASLPSEMRLADGRRLHVIYPGIWTHSNGPDFASALLDIDGKLIEGSIEIHVRASDWNRHGHSTNARYNDVVLHVVYFNDLDREIERPNGSLIPTLEVQRYLHLGDHERTSPAISFVPEEGKPCLPTLPSSHPDLVRVALAEKGWERFRQKQVYFSQRMETDPPAQVLYEGVAEALGYSQNREQMVAIASTVPFVRLESISRLHGAPGALTALLGVAGFLPLSDRLQEIVGVSPGVASQLERDFLALSREWNLHPQTDVVWSLNRVRPLNHPARRLASLAELVASCAPDEGLFTRFIRLAATPEEWDSWLDGIETGIGAGRRQQIIVNIFAPMYAAYMDRSGDLEGQDSVAEVWESLRGSVRDSIGRAAKKQIAGSQRFPIRTALEEQGLHQIHRFGCRQLRCFECPIAALATRYES